MVIIYTNDTSQFWNSFSSIYMIRRTNDRRDAILLYVNNLGNPFFL